MVWAANVHFCEEKRLENLFSRVGDGGCIVRHRAGLRVLLSVGIVFIAAAAGPVLPKAKASTRCLQYEPAVVKLTGTLIRQTFAGPPNYESIRKGDQAETSWLIKLPNPVCVDQDKADPLINTAKRNVRMIQLVLDQKMYKQYRNLVSHKVVATGTLFGEHTGHHHTPVLLTVGKLDLSVTKHERHSRARYD